MCRTGACNRLPSKSIASWPDDKKGVRQLSGCLSGCSTVGCVWSLLPPPTPLTPPHPPASASHHQPLFPAPISSAKEIVKYGREALYAHVHRRRAGSHEQGLTNTRPCRLLPTATQKIRHPTPHPHPTASLVHPHLQAVSKP